MTDTRNLITVMQVFEALGIQPTPSVSWSVGSTIANRYAQAFGEQPPKDNRPKTSGAGSHCFALYPPSWYGEIAKAIRAATDVERAQADMFGPPT